MTSGFAPYFHQYGPGPLAPSYDAALILLGLVLLISIAGRVVIAFSRSNAE
jgi:hypothetical protein